MTSGWKRIEARRTEAGDRGQTLAEYTLILLLVTLACLAAVTLLGIPIQGFYTSFNAGI